MLLYPQIAALLCKLLQFVLKQTKGLPRVKWIISSRNHIMQRTRLDDSQSILSLELQDLQLLSEGYAEHVPITYYHPVESQVPLSYSQCKLW
jgi:hypothetical protein